MSQSPHDFEEVVDRIDKFASEAAHTSSSAMGVFSAHSGVDDWLLVDRVLLIATNVRNELKKNFLAATDQHKRRVVAVALFELGELSVTDVLLDAVKEDSEIYLVAASKLANRGVEKAIKPILSRLMASQEAKPSALVTLLSSLHKLTTELPAVLYENLESHTSAEVRAVLVEFRSKSR
jgi:hypothetical protein